MDVWVEHEVDGGEFPDQRLKSRLGKLLGELGRRIGNTVPTACQDWAATKAAYRFFSNARVDEKIILAGHFAATKARFAKTQGSILVLHDTTEFTANESAFQLDFGWPPPKDQAPQIEGQSSCDTISISI